MKLIESDLLPRRQFSQEDFSFMKIFARAPQRATLWPMEQTLNPPARGAMTLTMLAYVPAVLAMMTVGVIVPFLDVLAQQLQAGRAQLGLGIALFSIPAAILATVGGGLIDEYGVRRAMLFGTTLSTAGSVLIASAHSLPAFDGALLLGGVGFGTLCIAAPCLIMSTLSDGTRTRSMAFVATYAPTGYAAGLLLAVLFTATGDWRTALLVHATLSLATLITLFLLLPRGVIDSAPSGEPLRATLGRMLGICREVKAWRLGLAVALPNAVSYGTSLASPSYLAQVHHMSIASSSAGVALGKLTAMILGGISMGHLLVRVSRPGVLFGCMAALGALAQLILFLPASPFALAVVALVVWLFAFGGMSGGAMSLLPVVARNPARSGAASGLVNQCISLASFATPSTWLAIHTGSSLTLLAAICLLVAVISLPTK
jgi:predicted MFS family arabinose efflux permease